MKAAAPPNCGSGFPTRASSELDLGRVLPSPVTSRRVNSGGALPGLLERCATGLRRRQGSPDVERQALGSVCHQVTETSCA